MATKTKKRSGKKSEIKTLVVDFFNNHNKESFNYKQVAVDIGVTGRSDQYLIADILDEQGDEIFSQADSILLEIDMEKDIVKRTFALAEKHRKTVYAVVSNLRIANERRNFLRSVNYILCNQHEAGNL